MSFKRIEQKILNNLIAINEKVTYGTDFSIFFKVYICVFIGFLEKLTSEMC